MEIDRDRVEVVFRVSRRVTMKAVLGQTRTWPTKQCLFGNIVGKVVIRLIGAVLLKQNDERAELPKVPPAQQVERQRRACSATAP